ncbi:MAG: formate/nitrite transporter family protein [Bacillota bacterium]
MAKSASETIKTLNDISLHKVHSPIKDVLILGFMAGIFISLGDLFMMTTAVGTKEFLGPGVAALIGGISFSVGLLLVVYYGAQLFTSNVLAAVPWGAKRLTFKDMMFNWILVYIANFAGSLFFAWFTIKTGLTFKNEAWIANHFIAAGTAKTNLDFLAALLSGIGTNILVCMAVYMAVAAEDGAGKVLSIMMPVAAFVAIGFEHSIANMYIIPSGIMHLQYYLDGGMGLAEVAHLTHVSVEALKNLNWYGFLVTNEIPVTIGNIIGGALFVGWLNWICHGRDTHSDKTIQNRHDKTARMGSKAQDAKHHQERQLDELVS